MGVVAISARGTQVINGTEYVYDYISVWDSQKQRSEQKRTYIGKMVNGEFVPNKQYQLKQELETAKMKVKPGPVPATECSRMFGGAAYLLDSIGEITGVTEDLRTCFPKEYKAILSLAYYLVMENDSPMYRFHKWSRTHEHPHSKDIPSQRISDLFAGISEQSKMEFFRKQAKRRVENEFLAYDTTSISSYSRTLKQVRYGNNKEHDPLAQINLALLFGEQSGLPVCYRKLPGNISDVKTVQQLLKEVDFLEMDKVNLVMDRGFYSADNINALYRNHHKFLISTKTSLKFIKSKLDDFRSDFACRANWHSKTGLYAKTFTMDWDYTEKKVRTDEVNHNKRRMYVHYYYNDQHAADDKNRFNLLLDTLENELVSGHRNPEHEKLYTKYFHVKQTPKRGIQITPKDDAITDAIKNCGYFVLLSNGVKDTEKALEIYRCKDLVEKAFGNLKERLGMRRMSVSSEESLEGKLFVQFIALIYMFYIKKAMDTKGLFKNYTMQELLDEFDIIERFQHPGTKSWFGEITKKQTDLYLSLGVVPPSSI